MTDSAVKQRKEMDAIEWMIVASLLLVTLGAGCLAMRITGDLITAALFASVWSGTLAVIAQGLHTIARQLCRD